ncbi:sensor histidine kinase [Propionibacteriaceae bacterium G1746]
MIRWATSALVVFLTFFAVVTTPHAPGSGWHASAFVSAAALLASFAAGLARKVPSGVWLTAMLASWCWLTLVSPNAAFIAFPLYFIELYLLRSRVGIVVVGLTFAATVALLAWRNGAFSVGIVLGPLLGAGFAVVAMRSFQALGDEAERRQALLDELEGTRAELLEAERRAGRLEERERLAAEIHDTLAQGFTSIQLLLSTAQRVLPTDPTSAAGLVDQARSTAAENLTEARQLVAGMAPTDLAPTAPAHSTLADALRRLAGNTTARGGPATTAEVADDMPALDVATQAVLVRVAQSAVANVVQHADADQLVLALSTDDDRSQVSLAVTDDGRGFDVDAPSPGQGRGFGLGLMRRRVEQAGGSLTVSSTPGGGTAVTATLPVSSA